MLLQLKLLFKTFLIKLSSGSSELVNFLVYGLLVFCVTLGCLLGAWYQAAESLELDRMQRFGETIAAQAAALSIEPVLLNDRVSLGVLASRLNAFPEIRGIGIYSIDGQELTLTGIINNRTAQNQFRHPIELQDSVAGYVRIELDSRAFVISFGSILWAPMSISLLITILGAIVASGFSSYWQTADEDEPESEADDYFPGSDPAESILAISLFKKNLAKQFSPEHYHLCLGWVKKAANLHAAQIQETGNGNILLTFNNVAEPDAAYNNFNALRCALLIRQLLETLAAEEGWQTERHAPQDMLDLRFGLHWHTNSTSDLAIEYAILLCAVAASGQMAASSEFIQQIPDPDQPQTVERQNLILADLSPSTSEMYFEIGDLNGEQGEQLDAQTDTLFRASQQNMSHTATTPG